MSRQASRIILGRCEGHEGGCSFVRVSTETRHALKRLVRVSCCFDASRSIHVKKIFFRLICCQIAKHVPGRRKLDGLQWYMVNGCLICWPDQLSSNPGKFLDGSLCRMVNGHLICWPDQFSSDSARSLDNPGMIPTSAGC